MKRRYTESVSGCAFLLSFNPCQTMKRALQNLFRKGEGNLIKILCLGVGMAIGLVMLAEVIFERSYDNFIPHLEDTYICLLYTSDAADE